MSDFEDFLEEDELSQAEEESVTKKISDLVKERQSLEAQYDELKLQSALISK